MLVLSRREGERIRIGDSIVVTVVRMSGDKVRIGIEAPSDVLVLRDELESRKPAKKENPPTTESVVFPLPVGTTIDPLAGPLVPTLG